MCGRETSTIIGMAVDRKSEGHALTRCIRLAERGRAGFELQPGETRIDAVARDERSVIALLDDATGLNDRDPQHSGLTGGRHGAP